MRAFGLSDELIQQAEIELKSSAEPFSIWPENARAVSVFCAMSGQWRISPRGSLTGFDYPALMSVLSMMQIDRAEWPEVFEQVQHMEFEAVRYFKAMR